MAIYKTRNTGTGNGMRECRGRGEYSLGFKNNFLEDSGECYYFNIPGNVEEDSGVCSRTFRGMLVKILGKVQEDSGKCARRFRGILKKILGNVSKDSGEC